MKTSSQISSQSKSNLDRLFENNTSYTINSNSTSNLSMRNQANFESLSDILMNKTGPNHQIGYLGSAILTKGKTGLGCLQQPLRELYCIFRRNGCRLMQERRLVISIDGLTMLYSDSGMEKFIHNDLSSVYDVQLLRLVNDGRKDRRSYAFIPVSDDETESRYSHLFQPIEKQLLPYLDNISHPPIVALIMRRSCGIQALECHVIITRTSNDAVKIVNDIKHICSRYKHELSQQTQVFDYNQSNMGNICQIRQVKTLNQLPPKSPHIKQHKPAKEEMIIYDAFKENKVSSKSTNDLSSKSSLFERIKIRKDKSSDCKNKKSMSSSSEVIFVENESKDNKASTSLVNMSDSDKKSSKKILKQGSLTSLNTTENEKKEKKQSLGKRIINSARSSLKSNSSKNKNLSSNSSSSFTSIASTKKELEKIADVDFRKSKTSILNDNLMIDNSARSHVYVQQSPSMSRPTNICLENRINLIPSSPSLTSTRKENMCKNRSKVAPSPTQLLNTESRSSSCNRTVLENSINFTKLDEGKYHKKVFKLPVSDPKLLANHLVWNKSLGSAECLDKEEITIRSKTFSPIAKIMSPGGYTFENFEASVSVKSDDRSRSYHLEDNKFRSKSQNQEMVFRPKPPTSNVPEINYTALKENKYFHDSAYSHESTKLCETVSEPKDEIVKSQNLVMNSFKQQLEEELERKAKLSITSHKIVGGVKVFPTLPQEFRHAAEMRQKRMAQIESNLNKTSSIEQQVKQKSQYINNESYSSYKEDDQEIIDLTINKDELNDSKMSLSFREIPIQIMTNKNEDLNELQNQFESTKTLISTSKNNFEYLENNAESQETTINKTQQTQKTNYLYYYDNEQFAGY